MSITVYLEIPTVMLFSSLVFFITAVLCSWIFVAPQRCEYGSRPLAVALSFQYHLVNLDLFRFQSPTFDDSCLHLNTRENCLLHKFTHRYVCQLRLQSGGLIALNTASFGFRFKSFILSKT